MKLSFFKRLPMKLSFFKRLPMKLSVKLGALRLMRKSDKGLS